MFKIKVFYLKFKYLFILGILAIIITTALGLKTVVANGQIHNPLPDEQNQQNQVMGTKMAEVDLPIIMYHSILKDANCSGDFVLTPNQLESDFKYIVENNYTPIVMADLLKYVYDDIPLPSKPIMITFDDGYYNNYVYALDLLKQYKIKAVLSPIAYQSEKFTNTPDPNPNYAHVTWDNLREMQESGFVEIQIHSYNMHNNDSRKGAKKKNGEALADYKKNLTTDTEKSLALFQKNLNYSPTTYTYPFGAFCQDSETILKEMGFKATLITCDKNNKITKDPNCLYKLNRYNRPAKYSTEEFMQKLQPKD